MSDFEEQWEVYPSRLDGEFAMFAVNVGLHDHAPFDNLRWLTIVRIGYGALGMPTAADNELMIGVEDFLGERASKRGALQVGRLTTAGRRELFFYGATDDSAVFKRELAEEFGDLEVELDTVAQRDPSWELYLDFLYPQPIDFQRISNQRVAHQLAEHGDVASIPRQIDHHALFPDEATRRDFARAVAQRGFTIDEEVEADDGKLRFALVFSSHGPVDLASIDQLTIPLFLEIEEAGGLYAGWGCAVQSAEGEPHTPEG